MTGGALALLEQLTASGIRLGAAIPTSAGEREMAVTPAQALIALTGPDALAAAHYDVTAAAIARWREWGFSAHCGATTRKGRTCQRIAVGGANLGVREWLALHRTGRCALHG